MNSKLPLARTNDLLVEDLGDETVVYDLQSKEVHCLAPLAALVFARCDGRTTPAECAAAAEERLGREVSAEQVLEAVHQLDGRSLIGSSTLVLHDGNGDGVSRREVFRRGTLVGAAAFATPLIVSIAAPTAMAGVSQQQPIGCTCGQNKDCATNHCCQSNAGKTCGDNHGCCVELNNSCHACTCSTGTCCTVVRPAGCPCLCSDPACVGECCSAGHDVCCATVSPPGCN